MFITGEYTYGAFRTCNGRFVLSDPDVLLILDGTQPHESDPFYGERYSVVAFLHKAAFALPPADLKLLRDLGLRLPDGPAPPVPSLPKGVSRGRPHAH